VKGDFRHERNANGILRERKTQKPMKDAKEVTLKNRKRVAILSCGTKMMKFVSSKAAPTDIATPNPDSKTRLAKDGFILFSRYLTPSSGGQMKLQAVLA
jgi:hypothetical protein